MPASAPASPGGTTGGSDGVRRPRVQRNVTRALAGDICRGLHRPGETLPTENELCLAHGVSRTVIREALKTLESKGLVIIRSRVGTQVAPREAWNILDPQVLDWVGPHLLDADLLTGVLEARRVIEPEAASLAASRATLQDLAEVEQAFEAMRAAQGDVDRFTHADVAFHVALLKASRNRVFMQFAGLIEAAMRHALRASNAVAELPGEAIAAHGALVEALRLRDAAAARLASGHILDLGARDIATALQRGTAPPS
ncbi:FCD domain-containing protein [Microvirga tunisiensis]|uniref:FCD domain-containing protein n=1 Tax=Pannonibacter tanglangensis TaxID=2750084 RepID=A0ABW9ZKH4_9HYPH|nr:FadR/GntR family transcriptional regulator [Pannonibacter sp. XCT-34]NBN65389.1 FCD domain-containing protein [Pannonibacter sp. XCT-34]